MMNSRLGPGEPKADRVKGAPPLGATFCVTSQPTRILGYSIDILLPHLSHVAQHGEDDEARQEASQTVHRAGDQSVSVM